MSSRNELLRQVLVLAAGIAIVIVLLVVIGVWLSGAFSFVMFAHWLLTVTLGVAVVEMVIVLRVMRTTAVPASGATWRRVDHSQGCTAALLVGLIMLGLFFCGGMLEWWLEFR